MPKKNGSHTPQTKELISQRVEEAHRRAREAVVQEVTTKRCTTCGERKPCRAGESFSMRRRVLADGSVTIYPAGECKHCTAARSKAHRDSVGREEMRKREIEYQRTYRRKLRLGEKLDSGPIGDFVTERIHRHGMSAIESATGIDHKILNEIANHTYKTTELHTVDRILVGLQCTDQLHVLYPQEDAGDNTPTPKTNATTETETADGPRNTPPGRRCLICGTRYSLVPTTGR